MSCSQFDTDLAPIPWTISFFQACFMKYILYFQFFLQVVKFSFQVFSAHLGNKKIKMDIHYLTLIAFYTFSVKEFNA